MFYLATSPSLYGDICRNLSEHGLVTPQSRVVLEKPIGTDLGSAERINDEVGQVFEEKKIFRIDHYLGKETVQNLLALRFANVVFERLWNQRTRSTTCRSPSARRSASRAAATTTTTPARCATWCRTICMQLLCLLAMEPPDQPRVQTRLRDEKLKVLRSLKPIAPHDVAHVTVRGQYAQGKR